MFFREGILDKAKNISSFFHTITYKFLCSKIIDNVKEKKTAEYYFLYKWFYFFLTELCVYLPSISIKMYSLSIKREKYETDFIGS